MGFSWAPFFSEWVWRGTKGLKEKLAFGGSAVFLVQSHPFGCAFFCFGVLFLQVSLEASQKEASLFRGPPIRAFTCAMVKR